VELKFSGRKRSQRYPPIRETPVYSERRGWVVFVGLICPGGVSALLISVQEPPVIAKATHGLFFILPGPNSFALARGQVFVMVYTDLRKPICHRPIGQWDL
jgi:hypothetical protein